jgi:hypothetical protein
MRRGRKISNGEKRLEPSETDHLRTCIDVRFASSSVHKMEMARRRGVQSLAQAYVFSRRDRDNEAVLSRAVHPTRAPRPQLHKATDRSLRMSRRDGPARLMQQQTHALQHDCRLFLHAALDLQAQTERPPRGGLSVPSRRKCIKVGIRTLTGANLGDGVRAACYQYSAQSLTGSAVMASPLSGGGESNPIPTFVISC